jgi:hypothetical protein
VIAENNVPFKHEICENVNEVLRCGAIRLADPLGVVQRDASGVAVQDLIEDESATD